MGAKLKAVSEEINQCIQALHQLPSLQSFALGGGTNLALRYQHRRSYDIDLFTNEVVGKKGFQQIFQELQSHFGLSEKRWQLPCQINDRLLFGRAYLPQKTGLIQVEILQGFPRLDPIESIEGIEMLSEKDVGCMKLMSAIDRQGYKDIYDLNEITNRRPLSVLYEDLKQKEKQFQGKKYQTIFDVDRSLNPINDPSLWVSFDQTSPNRPRKEDQLVLLPDSVSWPMARMEWKRKVMSLCLLLEKPYPDIKAWDTQRNDPNKGGVGDSIAAIT